MTPTIEASASKPIATPEHQDLWRGTYRDLAYKVSLHAKGQGCTPGGEGIWCFYVYLPEEKCADFAAIWLADKMVKITPESKGFISHDYYGTPLDHLDMHGGITYYAKHGYTEGRRCVEVGCDYGHLWDHERAGGYSIDQILYDVKKAIDSFWNSPLPLPAS